MANFLNILILEDVKSDALLIEYQLKKASFKYQSKLVDNKQDFIQALNTFNPDLILSDYNLPGFLGTEVLEIAKQKAIDIPFIFVTGYLDENIAIDFIKKGAWDYVLKENYVRLLPAIENALKLKTERIKLSLAFDFLETAKLKYQDLYEHAPDMYLTIHFDTGFITDCNQTILENTGYLKSELLNRSVFDFYPLKNTQKIRDLIVPELIKTGKINNAELEIIKKDGSIIYGLINVKAEYNAFKRISSIKLVIRDVTVRKQQETAIKESEARFKTIFNKSEDPILILDYKNHEVPLIKDINSNFISKIGYSQNDLIGQAITVLIPHIPKAEIQKHIQKLINGTSFHDKITLNLIENKIFYFDVVGTLIRLNNKEFILISARDITEQYKANIKLKNEKEKFVALSTKYKQQNLDLNKTLKSLDVSRIDLSRKVDIINRSPAVSFSWLNEPGWPVNYVSENTENIFGYQAQDFLSGKINYRDIIHPDDIKRVIEEVANGTKNNNKKISHKSYRIISKDKTVKWINDDTVIIKNNGEPSHFEGVITDVTKTINYQNELLLSKNKYKSILDSNPDVIIITSKNKEIEFLNTKAEKQFGSELIGKNCHQSLFGFESPCEWCSDKHENFNEKNVREIQNPIDHKQYILSTSKIQNEDQTNSYMAVYKDVTELRRIQNERLKLLKTLEAGINEIYLFDTETLIFQYTNKRAAENLGYHPDIISELTPVNFQTEYNEQTFRSLIRPLLTGNKSIIRYETNHRRKDNSLYPVEVSLQLIKQQDESVFLAVINDISDRIEKDDTIKKLSTVIEQSPITIVITDTEGKIEYVNPKFEETTGYSFKEAIGQNPSVLKSGNQSDDFYKDMWKTISSDYTWKGEFHNKRKDGSTYWEDAVISPVKNTEGIITHFIAMKEDITEHKQIQEKLIQSELHFRKLFENSLIGMYLSTPEGQIVNANKTICNMLGYTIDELKKINLKENRKQSNRRSVFKTIIENQSYIHGFETKWKTKTGENIYVRESARKFLDDNGNVFYEGTVENITKQKLASRALKEIHGFNKKIIKAGKLGYATYRETGECIAANESYVEIVGGTKEQILKQNFYTIKNWETNGLLISAKKCLTEGSSFKLIIDSESSFNKHIWIEIHFSRIYKAGEVRLLVIIKDISSFIKAKKRQFQTKSEYYNLVSNINVPIFGINKDANINEWNRTLEKITGYKRKDVKGKKLIDLLKDKNDKSSASFITESSLGNETFNIEINLKTKYKNTVKLLISTTIRRDIYNKIDGIICVGQDVTKIHKDKEELERRVEERTHELIDALKKEKELGDLKSQFVSMASHEFRTPLAAISFASGFVKKYWEKIDATNREKKLNKIDTQVKHMTSLLDDVLTLGKTESGKIKFEPKETNLISFLNEIIEEIQNVNNNSHKIILNSKKSISMLMLDQKIGKNIFTNLITNAIKFSPDSNRVYINIFSSESETKVEIIDKGIGIHKNELEHIFTPFHRGQNVSTIQGTGLGLAIVKESINIMKGEITAESKPGEGTKFTITLPKYN